MYFLQHDLKTEDFTEMSAPLLYEMFKSKSGFPLHLAVRHHREDVVFLFLIEFDSQVHKVRKENDHQGLDMVSKYLYRDIYNALNCNNYC